MAEDRPVVLVVDDDPAIADGHAARLADRYETRTAYSGEGALDALDDSVGVVLLDRRMPDLTGDEVLDHIRQEEYPCRVAMLTAVDPTLDVIEMGFDGYLQKPVSRTELLETVESLFSRVEYDTKLQEYFSVASKVALLQTEYETEELEDADRFKDLTDQLDALRGDLDDTLTELSPQEGYAVAAGGTAPIGDEFDA